MDIYDKIFTYIEHNNDLTSEIAENYKNSLIFIGDEQQIWQPLTNTYVGIGKSFFEESIRPVFLSTVTTNTNASYYITFSGLSEGFGISYTDLNLQYNPYLNKLITGYFEGDLLGNAKTAYRLYGNNSYTAWGNTFWSNGIPKSIEGTISNTYNIISAKDNTYTIGEQNNKYAYAYINSVVGNLYGNATTSINANYANIANNSNKVYTKNAGEYNGSYYITLANTTGDYSYAYTDIQLHYNPNTNTLHSDIFNGRLDGDANTAYRLNGNNSYTAWGNTFWSNGIPKSIEGTISNTYNIISAKDNTYTIGEQNNKYAYAYINGVVGNLYGNATTSTNAKYANISDNSNKVFAANANEYNGSYYITLTNTTGEYAYTYTDIQLHYNPGTNTLHADVFNGNLEGNASSADKLNINGAYTAWGIKYLENGMPKSISGNISNTGHITSSANNKYTIGTSSNKYAYAYINNVVGTLYGDAHGNADTASLSSYSIYSYNTDKTFIVNAGEYNGSYYITLTNTTGKYAYTYTDGQLHYNPSTNTLHSDKFNGNLEGNASSADKLNINDAYTAWGIKYWENGLPKSISGNISNTGHITPNANNKSTIGTSSNKYAYAYINGVVGTLYGDVHGNADTATNAQYSNISNNSNKVYTANANEYNGSYYITLANTTGDYSYAYTDTQLHYNPSTNTLYSEVFNGRLDGDANTSYRLYGNNSYTAWGATFWENGVPKSIEGDIKNSYDITPYVNNKYTIGKSNNKYAYAYINSVVGNLYGNATTSTNANYANISNNSNKVYTANANEYNGSYYITLANTTGDYSYAYTDTQLHYNPSTNTLTTTYFIGNLKGHADSASKIILYQNIYIYSCTANDTPNGYIFFGNIIPKSNIWQEPYWIKYRVTITTDNANCHGEFDVWWCVSGSTITYKIWNTYYSTSYYPAYYHILAYHNTQAKYNNRSTYKPKIGLRIQSAWSPTSSRTYTIRVYECHNCDFEFPENIEVYKNVYSDTNYALYSVNSTSQGLQETGDITDITTLQLTYSRIKAGSGGIMGYSLIMQDSNGTWQSFTTTSGTGISKTKNTAGFKLGSRIYYMNMSGNITAGNFCGNSIVRAYSALVDLRYSFNNITANSLGHGLIYGKPVYVVGTIGVNDLFYLDDNWWTQDEPTSEDEKIYIRVVEAVYPDYNTSTMPSGNYRGDLISDGYAFWFKNGTFQRYIQYSNISYKTNKVYTANANEYNGSYYITLANTSDDYAYAYTDTQLYYNPSTNTLHSEVFNGRLDGDANTSYRLYGNNSYTAWGTTFWENGVPKSISGNISNTGYITPSANNKYTIGTSSNKYAYAYINGVVGNLYGNATTATTANYANTANNSNKVYTKNANEYNGSYYITLANTSDDYAYAYTDNALYYNPATNTLYSDIFNGRLDGDANTSYRLYGNNSYTAWGTTFWENGVPKSISGNISNTGYITPSANNKYTIGTSSNKYAYAYINGVVGTLYGDAHGNADTATNAQYSNISNNSNKVFTANANEYNGSYYITLANTTGDYTYAYTDGQLRYNPYTNTAYSEIFKGRLDGDANTAYRLNGNNSYTAWGTTFWENGVPKSIQGDIKNSYNITPYTNNKYTIGTSSNKYAYAYINGVVGNLYGNATTATTANYANTSNNSNKVYTKNANEYNGSYYITLANTSDDYAYAYTDNSLHYNPGTNTLYSDIFNGNLEGNAKTSSKLQGNNSYTAWGVTFWENGVPKSIEGDIKNSYNITPYTNNKYTIGDSSKKYAYAYINGVVGTLYGDVHGNADTATNAQYSNVSNISNKVYTTNANEYNGSYYITLANTTGDYTYAYTDGQLRYNPYTNTAYSNIFEGELNGNAKTSSKLQGNNSYTAWGATFWENGVPKSIQGDIKNSYNITPYTNNKYTIGTSSNKYAYAYINGVVGNLYGNATTSTNANYANISNNSNKVFTANANEYNGSYYITLANTTGEYAYAYTDNALHYNPGINTLYSDNFVGRLDPELQWGTIVGID